MNTATRKYNRHVATDFVSRWDIEKVSTRGGIEACFKTKRTPIEGKRVFLFVTAT